MPTVLKSGNPSMLELSVSVQVCTGIALPLPLPFKMLMGHYQEVNMVAYQRLAARVVWFMRIGNKKHIQSIARSLSSVLEEEKPTASGLIRLSCRRRRLL